MKLKTCSEIRRENLERLLADGRTLEFIAEKSGLSPNYLSQVRRQAPDSKTKKLRVMGDPAARKIEEGFNLGIGWMDHDHSEPLYSTSNPIIARAAEIMEEYPGYAQEFAIKNLAESLKLITDISSAATEQRDQPSGSTKK